MQQPLGSNVKAVDSERRKRKMVGGGAWTNLRIAMRNNMRCSFPLQHPSPMASRAPLSTLSRVTRLINAQRPWKCSACRHGLSVPLRRGFATTPGKFKKPYYVTTPIFYVNAGEFRPVSECGCVFLTIASSTSPPCRPPVHDGHRRYLEAMAGLTRKQGRTTVDRNR
jgi:hypothetical protein